MKINNLSRPKVPGPPSESNGHPLNRTFLVASFVLSFCPFDISVGVGAFVIGLSQISFLSFYTIMCHIGKAKGVAFIPLVGFLHQHAQKWIHDFIVEPSNWSNRVYVIFVENLMSHVVADILLNVSYMRRKFLYFACEIFSPPAHLCAVICLAEKTLIVTLKLGLYDINNLQINLRYYSCLKKKYILFYSSRFGYSDSGSSCNFVGLLHHPFWL